MIPPAYILLVSVAGFVQGTVGFAFALLTVPLLTLVVTPGAATALGSVLGTVVVVTGIVLHRDEIEWRGMLALTAVAVVFLPFGALFVARAPESVVLLILGAIAFLVGVDSMLRQIRGRRIRQAKAGRLAGAAVAAVSGTLGGAFATPGPPMVAYLYATTPDRHRAKANLQAFFILTSILTVVTQGAVGNLTVDLLPFALQSALPVAVATAVGVHLSRRLNTWSLRLATDGALIGLGIVLCVRALA